MMSRRRFILATVLALLAPGLGRAATGQVFVGISLSLLYKFLLWINSIWAAWLQWTAYFLIWSSLAALDVGFLVRRVQQQSGE